jgi:3-oxoacyl-[acyl-carrier-protein] synthase II
VWDGLQAGACGLRKSSRLDLSGFACTLAGEIKDENGREFSAKDYVPKSYRKAVKVMARDTEIAVACAKLAVDDAGWITRGHEGGTPTYPGGRVGCHIGAGLIAAETLEVTSALATSTNGGVFDTKLWGTMRDGTTGAGSIGMDNLQPLWMLKYLPNMLACHVTIIHGCEGPSNTITCAEASGLLSIGESARVIERGAADACFSGSCESKVLLMGALRTELAGRSGRFPEDTDPAHAVRPFDPTSPGTVTGEGGGILCLEELEAAKARGAAIYAIVQGFGAAHSRRGCIRHAHDARRPTVNDGLVLAIRAALKDADTRAEEIDAIVPQGCGQPALDAMELGALREVFGDVLSTIEIITTSPQLGDCAAGCGGVLACVASMTMRSQTLPARLGARSVTGLLAHRREATAHSFSRILVCSGSMTGQNAALVLGKAVR